MKNAMIRNTKTAVAIGSFLFLLSSLINDLNTGGNTTATGYAVTKMALGTLGIGLGFGLPTYVYQKEELSPLLQVLIHMGVGCTVMLGVGFLVGWIPTGKGLLPALLAVASMLLTAFIVWGITYRRQRKLARQINQMLEQRGD